MTKGWSASAEAWIATVGEDGDWGRRHVLDAPMLARVRGRGFVRALDIGCGEGRFCRMMQPLGVRTLGIDPVERLIAQARRRDPAGEYRVCGAESLEVEDGAFDLAVSYLSLIDISGLDAALSEAHRALAPGGTLLIANLQSFNTAADPIGWSREADGSRRFSIDHYLQERVNLIAWNGIEVQNWHRPLSRYLQALLDTGFALRHFAEPEPVGIDDEKARRYRRAPNFLIMEWKKDG